MAEDSYLIREYLAETLSLAPEVELAALCCDGDELRTVIAAWRPDVIVTDIRMPPGYDQEGIRIAAQVHRIHPEVGVVVLSQSAEPAYAIALLEQGWTRRAYLLKERIRNRRELVGAIETVAQGGSVIDPTIVELMIEAHTRRRESPLACLTARERRLLLEVATGRTDAAIAESLLLSRHAVGQHVGAVFSKLSLPDIRDVSFRVRAALLYLAEQDPAPSRRS